MNEESIEDSERQLESSNSVQSVHKKTSSEGESIVFCKSYNEKAAFQQQQLRQIPGQLTLNVKSTRPLQILSQAERNSPINLLTRPKSAFKTASMI